MSVLGAALLSQQLVECGGTAAVVLAAAHAPVDRAPGGVWRLAQAAGFTVRPASGAHVVQVGPFQDLPGRQRSLARAVTEIDS